MGNLSGAEFLSVGHSNRSFAELAGLLARAGATAVADVRSVPMSRRHPWFDGAALRPALAGEGIAYAFLGDALGGRPARDALYREGVADYEAMALEPSFAAGLARLARGAETHRIALMCSEGDPMDCHRCLLVGRALSRAGARLTHLRHGADPVTQESVEATLLGSRPADLFAPRDALLSEAYAARARRVAYTR